MSDSCLLIMFYFLDNVYRMHQQLYLPHAVEKEKTP